MQKTKPNTRKRPEISGNQSPGTVPTQVALAAACGVTAKCVFNWKQDPKFPQNPDGSFSVWAVAQWYAEKYPVTGGTMQPDASEAAAPALHRLREHKAGLAELELQQRRGELIERAFVAEIFSAVGMAIRRLGERLATDSTRGVEFLEEALADIERLGRDWVKSNVADGGGTT